MKVYMSGTRPPIRLEPTNPGSGQAKESLDETLAYARGMGNRGGTGQPRTSKTNTAGDISPSNHFRRAITHVPLHSLALPWLLSFRGVQLANYNLKLRKLAEHG
jgi:hypothetical protein